MLEFESLMVRAELGLVGRRNGRLEVGDVMMGVYSQKYSIIWVEWEKQVDFERLSRRALNVAKLRRPRQMVLAECSLSL